MGEYYNKGRTPTSATTRSGVSVCFSPRIWQYVALGEESSGSIQALVRKGFLTRRDSLQDHVVAPADGTVPEVVEVPVVLTPAPVPVAAEEIVEASSPNSEVPAEEEIKKEVDADVAMDDPSGTESLSRSRSSRRR